MQIRPVFADSATNNYVVVRPLTSYSTCCSEMLQPQGSTSTMDCCDTAPYNDIFCNGQVRKQDQNLR